MFKYTVGDYGLNRIDAWYGAPIGEWKLGVRRLLLATTMAYAIRAFTRTMAVSSASQSGS